MLDNLYEMLADIRKGLLTRERCIYFHSGTTSKLKSFNWPIAEEPSKKILIALKY
jgi:hypothetical protein